MSILAHKDETAGLPVARLAPLTAPLIGFHDQKNWAMTKDGLICAPIGFYRAVEHLDEDTGLKMHTLAFAFKAEELDIVSDPHDPERKILKNPHYILKPA